MKAIINDSATLADIKSLPFKANYLKMAGEPEIFNALGEQFGPKTGQMANVVANRGMCNKRHVQLHSQLPITVTYTLPEEVDVESLLVSTFSGFSVDYGYGRYEVYLSIEKESLYDPENMVSEYDRRGVFDKNDVYKGTAQIFTLCQPIKAKYFGIKFTHGCLLDEVVRLDFAGVFVAGAVVENEMLMGYGANLLENSDPINKNGISTYLLGEDSNQCDILIVRDDKIPVEVSIDGENFAPIPAEYKKENLSGKDYYISRAPFEIRAIRSAIGNLAGAFASEAVVTILPDEVINEDFIGAGTNVLPLQLMEESTKKYGYDPEFLKLEKEAIRQLNPKIIRVWFQNDWFQLAPDEYDFEQEKMQQFYECMDVFREMGTEIELNFSFVVGKKLHSWFTIPEVVDQLRSAPRDTKQFARSVVACLKYLTDVKGYNIKYLTVSNEPENGNFAVTNHPDPDRSIKKAYYAKTILDIDEALKAAGIRDRFEIWGSEDSSYVGDDWLPYMYRVAGYAFDRYTKHCYETNNDELLNVKIPIYKESTNNGRICLTEFGCQISLFEKSTIGHLISAANGGMDAALHWCLTNSVLTDPFDIPFDEELCLYRNYGFKNEGLHIEAICAEYGVAMSHIPAHCRVIKCLCNNSCDLRAAVFEKDGDYVVVVETAGSGERDLVINLGEITDKPFYFTSYNIEKRERPTTILPELSPATITDGYLRLRLPATHHTYLFTTKK